MNNNQTPIEPVLLLEFAVYDRYGEYYCKGCTNLLSKSNYENHEVEIYHTKSKYPYPNNRNINEIYIGKYSSLQTLKDGVFEYLNINDFELFKYYSLNNCYMFNYLFSSIFIEPINILPNENN